MSLSVFINKTTSLLTYSSRALPLPRKEARSAIKQQVHKLKCHSVERIPAPRPLILYII